MKSSNIHTALSVSLHLMLSVFLNVCKLLSEFFEESEICSGIIKLLYMHVAAHSSTQHVTMLRSLTV